jgi:hypothetical protein
MNTGTKIRTALRIAVSLNTAIYAVSAAVGALGFGWLTMAWTIFTILSDFAVSALTTYFNQDYTEEACIGTGVTRQLKAEKKSDYAGDFFYSEELPAEQEEVVEDIYEEEQGTEDEDEQ